MSSIEHSVKAQFAKVYPASAWRLLKQVAESNLREAAELRMKDRRIDRSLTRKRLLIGIGVELSSFSREKKQTRRQARSIVKTAKQF